MTPTRRFRVWIHVAALAMSGVVLGPIVLLAKASVSPATDLMDPSYHWLPTSWSLSRYGAILTGSSSGSDVAGAFRQAMINSLQVAAGTTVISVVVGALAGYAFARLRFRLRRMSLLTFLTIYMIPPIALVIPLYLALAALGMLDTKLGLAITYCSIVTPFTIWTMSNYFSSLPGDLEEAAQVDGCTRVGAFVRVILPLATPGLFTTAMFGFLLAWDEFLYALIFTSSSNSKTIPVAIAEFTGKYSSDFGLIAAGGVLAAVPPVLLALAFQRYVVGGLTSGSVKG